MQLSQAHRPWAVKMTESRGKVFWCLFPSQQHLAFFYISTKETKLLTFPGRLDFPEPWGFGPVQSQHRRFPGRTSPLMGQPPPACSVASPGFLSLLLLSFTFQFPLLPQVLSSGPFLVPGL